MKSLFGSLVFGFISLLVATARGGPAPMIFYVSPEGNDLFTGTLARNNGRRTDGPFASIGHARDAARIASHGASGKVVRSVTVVIRGGTYWLQQPLILGPSDSGTAEFPIIYTAYPHEKPVLSAGRPIRGWGLGELNGHKVWTARIPTLRDADVAFHELWVAGRRATLARSPNEGFYHAGQVPGLKKDTPLQVGQKQFEIGDGDVKALPDIQDADVVLMSLWIDSHLPIESVDEAKRLLTFTRPTVLHMSPGDPYFVEGAAELLDAPGEWYFNQHSATIYYLPRNGETMIGSEAVMPWHQQVVRLQGDLKQGQFVNHVKFSGLTFSHSEWDLPRQQKLGAPPTSSGFSQAAIGVPGAVWGVGVHDCVFEDCTISHAGNYGIELGAGCQRNVITHCQIVDLGAGGVKFGSTSLPKNDVEAAHSNQLLDSTVADCGKLYPSAVGVWIGQSSQNVIVHNAIHDLYYTGISIGWTWGYGPSAAGDNLVELNDIHHIGRPQDSSGPVLSDMGGIYTLGKQPGTVIRNNRFHDISALRYGGWGIYFDEGSSGLLAENNLVYNTTHGGFHQHYGQDNIVRNNIFALGRDAQIQRTRQEDHRSFTFTHNIVYWDSGSLLAGKWADNVEMDDNIFWHVSGSDVKFAGKTFTEWQKAGKDAHSRFADPQFADPKHGNFQIRAGVESLGSLFVPFDVSTAGPRP